MRVVALLSGLELVLIVALVSKLRELRRLEREIHATTFDLALALTLASRGQYAEAHQYARQWHERFRALERGVRYQPRPRPSPGKNVMFH